MIKFDIQVDIPSDILAEPASIAKEVVAVQAMKDTNPYTPFRTGSMSQRTRVEGGAIVYPGPYARYLYFGKLMVDPETGSSWTKKGARKVLTDKNLVFTTDFHPMAQDHWFEVSKAANMEKWARVAGKAMKRELSK